MNPRERHLAAIHNEELDRVNIIASEGLRSGPQGGWIRRLKARGMGITHIIPPYRPMFFYDHMINPYLEDVIYSQTYFLDKGVLKVRHVFDTPVGKVDSIAGCNPDDNFFARSPITHFVKEEEDWRVINYIFRGMLDALRPNYEEMLLDLDGLGDEGYTHAVVDKSPFQRAWIELAELERTALDFKFKPDDFLEYLDLQFRFHRRAAEITAGCPSEHIILIDNITNVISPAYYREYCMPVYQIYADAISGTNKVLAVHHDGLLGHIKREIADSPIDVIDSFTVPPIGDVSLTEARQLWPNKHITVNLPPHLASSNAEEMRRGYEKILEEWGSNNLTITHVEDLPPSSIERSLSAALDVCGFPSCH